MRLVEGPCQPTDRGPCPPVTRRTEGRAYTHVLSTSHNVDKLSHGCPRENSIPSHAASSRPSPMRRNHKDEVMCAKLKTLLRRASERSIEASGTVSANSATCWSCSAKSLATAIEDTLSLITAISELR